jgi:hypothetical protein
MQLIRSAQGWLDVQVVLLMTSVCISYSKTQPNDHTKCSTCVLSNVSLLLNVEFCVDHSSAFVTTYRTIVYDVKSFLIYFNDTYLLCSSVKLAILEVHKHHVHNVM